MHPQSLVLMKDMLTRFGFGDRSALVLDVGSLQETQTAIFVKRNVVPDEGKLQRHRMRGCSEENGLPAQGNPLLVVLQYLSDYCLILAALIDTGNQLWLLPALAL